MSVVSVRKSLPRDDSGNVDARATPDTIAGSATFHDPLGFFSLTEYLHYVQRQLRKSHQWAEHTRSKEALEYLFPWRNIDSAQVKAVGFESKRFEFALDKPKILNLLTGHMLYSNPNVVVRELIQNSLDAVRLQTTFTGAAGIISLHFDSKQRLLTVDDNGTGMTQQVIEDHFLNVGSSRYRDESFRKQFPAFSAISRFGIGILSAFMVSDEIEVITKSTAETKARNISIRSINGRYLIRLVDVTDPSVPAMIRDHGTRIQLRIRAGAALPDLKQTAETWIVLPQCEVTVQVDDGRKETVGYSSLKHALENTLRRLGLSVAETEPDQFAHAYKAVEKRADGLAVAFALEWSPDFKTWNFVTTSIFGARRNPDYSLAPGVCIHGVRVENSSPGYTGQSILAISNMSGTDAPATNVARSSLEAGRLTEEMLGKIYDLYAQHVALEITEMSGPRGFSISKAASEARYLLWPLQASGGDTVLRSPSKLKASLMRLPCLTVDKDCDRILVSADRLDRVHGFWTIESSAYHSSEDFIRKMPTGVTLAKMASLGTVALNMPEGEILSGYLDNLRVTDLLLDGFEVDRIEIKRVEGQVNFHWRAVSMDRMWRAIAPRTPEPKKVEALFSTLKQIIGEHFSPDRFLLQQSPDLRVEGQVGEYGVRSAARMYLFDGNPFHRYLVSQLDAAERGDVGMEEFAFGAIVLDRYWDPDENFVLVSRSVRPRSSIRRRRPSDRGRL